MSLFTLQIKKRNIRQLFIMYCCVLFFIVFLTPNRYMNYVFEVNVIPLVHTAERIHKSAGEHFWRYYINYWGNIFGNIILFMPFGFLLRFVVTDQQKNRIILYGLLTSIGIELTQLLLKIGVCDIDDVILNVIGTCIGILVYLYLKKYVRIDK